MIFYDKVTNIGGYFRRPSIFNFPIGNLCFYTSNMPTAAENEKGVKTKERFSSEEKVLGTLLPQIILLYLQAIIIFRIIFLLAAFSTCLMRITVEL